MQWFFLWEMCGYSYATEKCWCVALETWNYSHFPFTEGHQDGIGVGLKDSTITSNWGSLVEDDWTIRNVYL